MVSSLEVPVRAESAVLSLPSTGSEGKVTRLAFPLVYSGSAPAKVLSFAAASAGEAVELELAWPEAPVPWKAVCRLAGARLELPKEGAEEGRARVRLSLVLSRPDGREARELLEFLLDAAAAQVLELDLRAKIVQPPLPFEPEDELEPEPARAG